MHSLLKLSAPFHSLSTPLHCLIDYQLVGFSSTPSPLLSDLRFLSQSSSLLPFPECMLDCHPYIHLYIGLALGCATTNYKRRDESNPYPRYNPGVPFARIGPCAGVRIHAHTRRPEQISRLAGCRHGRTGATSDMSPTGCKWPRHVTEPSLIASQSQLDRLWSWLLPVARLGLQLAASRSDTAE